MTSDAVQALRTRVEQILGEHVQGVGVTEDGNYTLRNGSNQLFLETLDWGEEGSTIVVISAPLVWDAAPTPALFEWVAEHANDFVFGHLSVQRNDEDPNQVGIIMSHNLLGDDLTTPELMHALVGIGGVADQLDDELQAQFGGRRFHDEPAS